jgi:hypothetical protein
MIVTSLSRAISSDKRWATFLSVYLAITGHPQRVFSCQFHWSCSGTRTLLTPVPIRTVALSAVVRRYGVVAGQRTVADSLLTVSQHVHTRYHNNPNQLTKLSERPGILHRNAPVKAWGGVKGWESQRDGFWAPGEIDALGKEQTLRGLGSACPSCNFQLASKPTIIKTINEMQTDSVPDRLAGPVRACTNHQSPVRFNFGFDTSAGYFLLPDSKK